MKRIYIADIVHEQLKKEAKAQGRTLQWVVENKLTGEIPPSPKNTEPETYKEPIYMNHGGTAPSADVSGLFNMPDPDDIRQSNAELECCQHPSHPCKHWVWDIDTGEGYKNTLSGRYREAD